MSFPMSAEQSHPLAPAEMPSLGAASAHRIRRLGKRPMVFKGSELARAMSFTPGLPYWYELNIFRTDQQKFVLAIKLFFASEDEMDSSDAWEFDTLGEVFDAIEAYDAGRDVRFDLQGLADAPAAQMASVSMSLRAEVEAARAHFAGLVGELFQQLDDAA
ncbi:MAG: hypothetical protein ACOCTP_01305 [Roseicyclus sp.]